MHNLNDRASQNPANKGSKRLIGMLLLVALGFGGSLRVQAAAPPPAPAATPNTTTSSSSLADTTIHLYYLVTGYTDLNDPAVNDLCSARGAELKVGADDGTTLTVAVDTEVTTQETNAPACVGKYVVQYHQYTIAKSKVLNASATIQGFVSGVLAVPFKFHLSDHSTTAGSTIGGYVGYRTSVANSFTVTPVVAGGLALISTSPAQVTTSTSSTTTPTSTAQTSAGFSVATGFIGSVTSAASKGAQFGVLVGVDWLGKKANYAYDGKPWIAFEIGYNFAL